VLKIGDFSRLTRVSIRMLRHYDELGLLPPARIDPESGYRFYSADQLPRLNRILALQDLGFSLEQVGRLLEQNPSTEQLHGMLLMKQAQLQEKLLMEQERLARVAARLKQIETETIDSRYDVVLKRVESQMVLSVRGIISTYAHISTLFQRLFSHPQLANNGGLTGAIWHDEREGEIDAEAVLYLKAPLHEADGLRVYHLPEAFMASVVHHGSIRTLIKAYDSLVYWLDASGYQLSGPSRELYIHYTLPPDPEDESYVTEIQFPVERELLV
jgi:DNA-binding transcriptional MerR regulator